MLQLSRRRALGALGALTLTPLLPSGIAHSQNDKYGIVGREAPELDAEFWIDAKGEPTTFSLTAQRGKWVHLKCWQSWCPGCHSHGFPALQKLTEAFRGEPRVVNVGLQTTFEGHSTNTGDKVREIQQRYELDIPMGHDPGMRNPDHVPNTMRAYRTGGTPWHVVISPAGEVVFNGFGINADYAIEYLRNNLPPQVG